MEISEDNNEVVSPEAKRKIYSAALFDEELQDEEKEDDSHPNYSPA